MEAAMPADEVTDSVVSRFSGFAAEYDRFRAKPPVVITEIFRELARTSRPGLVVDLGCGTGLSTRIWADKAVQVVGIDPAPDMLDQARKSTDAPNVEYRAATSRKTGLPDQCADIVTCGMSLHWMDPDGLVDELGRILKPGGVFGSYWHRWPPTTGFWRIDVAYKALMAKVNELEQALGVAQKVKPWPRRAQEKKLGSCGLFRFTNEIAVCSEDHGNAQRLLGMMMTMGVIKDLLKAGQSEADIGLDAFGREVNRALGSKSHPWFLTYGLWYGVV